MTGTIHEFIPREIAKAEAQDEAAFAKLFEEPPQRKGAVIVWVALGVVFSVAVLLIWKG